MDNFNLNYTKVISADSMLTEVEQQSQDNSEIKSEEPEPTISEQSNEKYLGRKSHALVGGTITYLKSTMNDDVTPRLTAEC